MAGLLVRAEGGQTLGSTDGRGNLLLRARGREGDGLTYLLSPPAPMRLSGPARRRIVLRPTHGLRSTADSATEYISVTVAVTPRLVHYVLVVSADTGADLPVLVSGHQRGTLNSQGAALLLHEGLPGDEVTLRLMTDQDPRLRPRDPERTMVLPQAPAPLIWHQELTRLPVIRPVLHVKRRPVRRTRPTAI